MYYERPINLAPKFFSKQAIWISLVLLSPLALTGYQISLSTPNFFPQSQAKFYLQAMTKGQQAYYANNGQFANSIEKLSVDIDLETTEYRYSLVSQGKNAQSVLMTAVKTLGLPSYTG